MSPFATSFASLLIFNSMVHPTSLVCKTHRASERESMHEVINFMRLATFN
jgi:hypothetical protein